MGYYIKQRKCYKKQGNKQRKIVEKAIKRALIAQCASHKSIFRILNNVT